MIIAAAVRQGPLLIVLDLPEEGPPMRHEHIYQMMIQAGLHQGAWEPGFLTDHGEFLLPVDAAAYAVAVGQVTTLKSPPELISEDLW